MDKQSGKPSTSGGKRQRGYVKDEISPVDYLLKKLNSVAYLQRLQWVNEKYNHILELQQHAEATLTSYEQLYSSTQVTNAELEEDNKKQRAECSRYEAISKILYNRSPGLSAEELRKTEEQRKAAINEVTDKLDNATLNDDISVMDSVKVLHKEFKIANEELEWISHQYRKQQLFVRAEVDAIKAECEAAELKMVEERTALTNQATESAKLCAQLRSTVKDLEACLKQQMIKEYQNKLKQSQTCVKNEIALLEHRVIQLKVKFKRNSEKIFKIQLRNRSVGMLMVLEGEKLLLLKSKSVRFNLDKKTCLLLLAANGVDTTLPLSLSEPKVSLSKQFSLLKKLREQLRKVSAKCYFQKDKDTVSLLMERARIAKTDKQLWAIINIALGFMNVYNEREKKRKAKVVRVRQPFVYFKFNRPTTSGKKYCLFNCMEPTTRF